MRGHRAGNGPGAREGKRQQDHRPVDRDVRLDRIRHRGLGAGDGRQHEEIERQPDHDMRRRPGKTGVAPADGLEPQRGQRPADGGGKAREQRDAGDRAPRPFAIDAAERAEGGVVQAHPHADAEHQPGHDQHRDRIGEAKQDKACRQRQIGNAKHRAAADEIDLPADARADKGRDHQRGRERRKDPVRGNAEVAADRVGQNGGQVIAGSPGQRLRGAERQDDGSCGGVMSAAMPSLTSTERADRAGCRRPAPQRRRSTPVAFAGPPPASSATPTAHAPSADRLKPTVECIAMVAPRLSGSAAIVMPEVSAPESAGTVTAYTSRRGQQHPRRFVGQQPDQQRDQGGCEHHQRDGAMASELERKLIAENARGHGKD